MQNDQNELIAHLANELEKHIPGIERLRTLREVSVALSVPLFAVRRATKAGQFPTYRIGNGRTRVRLSEVISAVTASAEAAS